MEINHNISVRVISEYLQEQSVPHAQRYAFAYHITIVNNDIESQQLLSRYWLITDGDGSSNEVQGDGVIGQQPIIEPGQQHQYSSGAILTHPVGTMQGYYIFEDADGQQSKAPISPFRLAVASALN